MAVTPQSLINRAYRLAAGRGTEPHAAITIDNLWAFEEAFQIALSRSVEEIGYSAAEIEHYRYQHTLVFVNGITAMPQNLMHQFLDSSSVMSVEDQDESIPSSFCARYETFVRPPWPDAMHYYTSSNNQLEFRAAGGSIREYDGEVELLAVSTPVVPGTITDTMTLPEDIADRTVEILADMISGRTNA